MSAKPPSPLEASVLVFDRPFAVEYHHGEDLDDKVGECVYHEQRVRVSDTLPLPTEQQIVAHEIIHAADEIIGTGLKENQVQGMALVFCTLIRDNPHLVKYIQRRETV